MNRGWFTLSGPELSQNSPILKLSSELLNVYCKLDFLKIFLSDRFMLCRFMVQRQLSQVNGEHQQKLQVTCYREEFSIQWYPSVLLEDLFNVIFVKCNIKVMALSICRIGAYLILSLWLWMLNRTSIKLVLKFVLFVISFCSSIICLISIRSGLQEMKVTVLLKCEQIRWKGRYWKGHPTNVAMIYAQKNISRRILKVQIKVFIQKYSLPGLYTVSAIPLLKICYLSSFILDFLDCTIQSVIFLSCF